MSERDTPSQEPREHAERASSDPDRDPKVHPAPPSNPPADEQDVREGEEQLDRIVGN